MAYKINNLSLLLACRIKLVQRESQTFCIKHNRHTKVITCKYEHVRLELELQRDARAWKARKPLTHCGSGISSEDQSLRYLSSFILGKRQLPVPQKKDLKSLIKIIPTFSWTSKGSYETTFLVVKCMDYGA